MSLSWLDRLTLFIHPQRIVLERQPWRGAARRQTAEVAQPATAETDWQPALAAAEALLKADGKRGGSLRIVVADHFVRYALLPWSEKISGQKLRLAMARALLKNTLGDKVESLEIALDQPVFGKNGIAAGIDRQLLAGLRAAAKAQRLRLKSLQPRLIVELVTRRAQLSDGWFASIDREWLSLAGLRDGEIVSVRNHRACTGEAVMLANELAGLLVLENVAVNGKKLIISSSEPALPNLPGGWETTNWPAVVCGDAHA